MTSIKSSVYIRYMTFYIAMHIPSMTMLHELARNANNNNNKVFYRYIGQKNKLIHIEVL